jgi:hypothetical protein
MERSVRWRFHSEIHWRLEPHCPRRRGSMGYRMRRQLPRTARSLAEIRWAASTSAESTSRPQLGGVAPCLSLTREGSGAAPGSSIRAAARAFPREGNPGAPLARSLRDERDHRAPGGGVIAFDGDQSRGRGHGRDCVAQIAITRSLSTRRRSWSDAATMSRPAPLSNGAGPGHTPTLASGTNRLRLVQGKPSALSVARAAVVTLQARLLSLSSRRFAWLACAIA